MDPRDLSDDQLDQLAQQLAGRLPSGTHGDNVVLSRRQFALAASGVLSAGALTALGVDEASAQAAGQVGTSSSPVDAFAYDLDVQNGAEFNGTDLSGVGSLSTEILSHQPTEQTLSNGEISFSASTIRPLSEDGTDDTLTRVTGGSDGDILILLGNTDSTITVQHADGNLDGEFRLEGGTDKTLTDFRDRLLVQYDEFSVEWVQVSYSQS